MVTFLTLLNYELFEMKCRFPLSKGITQFVLWSFNYRIGSPVPQLIYAVHNVLFVTRIPYYVVPQLRILLATFLLIARISDLVASQIPHTVHNGLSHQQDSRLGRSLAVAHYLQHFFSSPRFRFRSFFSYRILFTTFSLVTRFPDFVVSQLPYTVHNAFFRHHYSNLGSFLTTLPHTVRIIISPHQDSRFWRPSGAAHSSQRFLSSQAF